MLLFRQLSHQENRLLSPQHGERAKKIDLTARNGYLSMRTITGDRLRLVLQPHAVCLSGFRNPRAPLKSYKNVSLKMNPTIKMDTSHNRLLVHFVIPL